MIWLAVYFIGFILTGVSSVLLLAEDDTEGKLSVVMAKGFVIAWFWPLSVPLWVLMWLYKKGHLE